MSMIALHLIARSIQSYLDFRSNFALDAFHASTFAPPRDLIFRFFAFVPVRRRRYVFHACTQLRSGKNSPARRGRWMDEYPSKKQKRRGSTAIGGPVVIWNPRDASVPGFIAIWEPADFFLRRWLLSFPLHLLARPACAPYASSAYLSFDRWSFRISLSEWEHFVKLQATHLLK